MTEPIAEGWVSVREAEQYTGYSASYIRILARNGRVTARKVNQGWLIDRASLLAFKRRMDALGSGKHDPTAPWRDDLGERGR